MRGAALIGMRRRLAVIVAAAAVAAGAGARDAHAERRDGPSIHLGVDLGTVIGHGPLVARLDPISTVGAAVVVVTRGWSASAGATLLRAGQKDPEGLGFTAAVRRHFDRTPLGRSFAGVGLTALQLSEPGMPRVAAGWVAGPKLVAGILGIADPGTGMRPGLAVAATYQWLVALDGGRAHGGYAGLELTLLHGFGL